MHIKIVFCKNQATRPAKMRQMFPRLEHTEEDLMQIKKFDEQGIVLHIAAVEEYFPQVIHIRFLDLHAIQNGAPRSERLQRQHGS